MSKLNEIGLRVVECGASSKEFGVAVLEYGDRKEIVTLTRSSGEGTFEVRDDLDGNVHNLLGDVAYNQGLTTGEVFGLVEKELTEKFDQGLWYTEFVMGLSAASELDRKKAEALTVVADVVDARISDGVGSVVVEIAIESSDGVYLLGGFEYEVGESGVNLSRDTLDEMCNSCLVVAEQMEVSRDAVNILAEIIGDEGWRSIQEYGISNIEDLGVKVSEEFSM